MTSCEKVKVQKASVIHVDFEATQITAVLGQREINVSKVQSHGKMKGRDCRLVDKAKI